MQRPDPNKELITAAKEGHADRIQALVREGAYHYDYAAEIAAENGHLDAVIVFINIGACPKLGYVMTAAIKGGHLHIVEYLSNISTSFLYDSILLQAVKSGHIHLVEWLTRKPIYRYISALEEAIVKDRADILELLIKTYNLALYYLHELLIIAIRLYNTSILVALLQTGRYTSYNYWEALLFARQRECQDIVELLEHISNAGRIP